MLCYCVVLFILLLTINCSDSFRAYSNELLRRQHFFSRKNFGIFSEKTLISKEGSEKTEIFGSNGEDIVWDAMRRDAAKGIPLNIRRLVG
jgi:hypothetical protein